jgi:hypothetical protein
MPMDSRPPPHRMDIKSCSEHEVIKKAENAKKAFDEFRSAAGGLSDLCQCTEVARLSVLGRPDASRRSAL